MKQSPLISLDGSSNSNPNEDPETDEITEENNLPRPPIIKVFFFYITTQLYLCIIYIGDYIFSSNDCGDDVYNRYYTYYYLDLHTLLFHGYSYYEFS
jgi:hypothetical protein